MGPRQRPFVAAAVVLGVAWALAFSGFSVARGLKVTPEKVRTYLHSVDFAHLSGPERAKALKRLARMLNALSLEERREARMDGEMAHWFAAMNDSEKSEFMEATLPTGFQQMLSAFEQLPPDKRRKALEDSVRRMREQARLAAPEGGNGTDTNAPPELTPELRDKAVQLGMKTFYDSGSPQLKAEMAPLLEEMQQAMEGGRLFRDGRRMRPEGR